MVSSASGKDQGTVGWCGEQVPPQPKRTLVTSIRISSSPKARLPATALSVVSAVTIAIYDREQAVKAEYGDVDVFGRDGETIEKILNRLVEHVLDVERRSSDEFQAWHHKVEQVAANQRHRGDEENYEALSALCEALKLLQHLTEEEASLDATKAGRGYNHLVVEQGFEKLVKLLMRAGSTRREVEDRIAKRPYL